MNRHCRGHVGCCMANWAAGRKAIGADGRWLTRIVVLSAAELPTEGSSRGRPGGGRLVLSAADLADRGYICFAIFCCFAGMLVCSKP